MTPEREEYGPLTDRDELSRMRALVDSLRAELAAAKVEREAVAVNAIHECADLRKALENTRAALKQVTAERDALAELERIADMTDEELLVDMRAQGRDPEAEAERVKEMLHETARKYREGIARVLGDPSLLRNPPVVADEAPSGCGACFACLDDPSRGLQNPTMGQMIVCQTCGNKRCPKGTSHENGCAGSNESGQPGSRY